MDTLNPAEDSDGRDGHSARLCEGLIREIKPGFGVVDVLVLGSQGVGQCRIRCRGLGFG